MKYVANPVVVDAFQIVEIRKDLRDFFNRQLIFLLESGEVVKPTNEILSRIDPKIGDYWVKQEDGYVYLNPKEVFERKYRKMEE